ncbi:MAG: lytic transglycosylase domain-containing protein [Polyangiales bacterium]
MRLTKAFLIMSCVLGGPGLVNGARAWSDAPLCVAQQPQLVEYSRPDDNAKLLCEADETYALQQGPLWTAPLWTAPISSDEARRALREATALAESAPADALLKLRLVERAMPRIADRLSLQRADLLMRLDRPTEACEAYRSASESPERNVAAEARIGFVRCLLEAGDRTGEIELDKLTRRYPALGERYALQVKLAQARERWNNLGAALPMYRNIDLHAPETGAAAEAREALARLHSRGVYVQPYTPQELVDRAERMVQRGTIEAGRSAVGDLLSMSALRGQLKGRVHLLAARVARMEGRWTAVRDEVTNAINSGIPTGEAQRWLPRLTVETLETGQGELRLKKLLAGRSVKRVKPGQLRPVLDIAVQYGFPDVATEALDAMTALGPKLDQKALYDAAIYASGVASDAALRDAFATLREVRGIALASRYYHARALERLGNVEQARVEFHDVSRLDDGPERYYGAWSEARLTRLDELAANSCDRDERGECLPDIGASRGYMSGGVALAPRSQWNRAAASEIAAMYGRDASEQPSERFEHPAGPSKLDLRRDAIVSKLSALVALHGEAYPWFARAADLTELERFDEAASEISEAYLAYNDARGGLRFRAGAEAVLTNATQARHNMPGNVRRDRLALDEWSRWSLAEVADLLEEPGVAVRLRSLRTETRPRAYSAEVERAAAKYGIDPNLMYAVMRVESVFYANIVSFVGAVGLMQIMPYTGMRIARALGLSDFNPRELLEPRKNIEFAAWYLSSLIRRFDGRVPLAVAAYNGGPHNVRLWLNAHPKTMPLDAFLERIPFRETNRYVRRVLGHYAAYRAQEDLAMPNLAITLPRNKPDAIAF